MDFFLSIIYKLIDHFKHIERLKCDDDIDNNKIILIPSHGLRYYYPHFIWTFPFFVILSAPQWWKVDIPMPDEIGKEEEEENEDARFHSIGVRIINTETKTDNNKCYIEDSDNIIYVNLHGVNGSSFSHRHPNGIEIEAPAILDRLRKILQMNQNHGRSQRLCQLFGQILHNINDIFPHNPFDLYFDVITIMGMYRVALA